MKPRKWLGYSIFLNDLLPESGTIIDRFVISYIPLDDTFGSSSDPPEKPTKYILSIGPGVEVGNLNDVIELLDGLEPEFINVENDGVYRKTIHIGSLTHEAPLIPFTNKLKEELKKLNGSPEELAEFLLRYNNLKLL